MAGGAWLGMQKIEARTASRLVAAASPGVHCNSTSSLLDSGGLRSSISAGSAQIGQRGVLARSEEGGEGGGVLGLKGGGRLL